MKYSKHFSKVVKENGQPNLSLDQFKKMMNIIATENKIEGLNVAKRQHENTNMFHQYDILILGYERQLTNLTGNQKPTDLIKEMYHFQE